MGWDGRGMGLLISKVYRYGKWYSMLDGMLCYIIFYFS